MVSGHFEHIKDIVIVYHDGDLDGDPAGEVLVAVEETCCPVQCVPSVIYEYKDHYPDCKLLLTFAHQMRMMKNILYLPIAGHSFGVLCAAHKNIHCSVAVICRVTVS